MFIVLYFDRPQYTADEQQRECVRGIGGTQ
mgnify:CR=1 FL=1